MLSKILTFVVLRFYLWPALTRYDAPRIARRPPPPIRRWRGAAVAHIGRRLVGLEIRLVIAPVMA